MNNGKILIIDNDNDSRALLKEFLSNDYIIAETDNVNDGLSFIKNNCRDVSLVLLDICIPNVDGFEFLKIINESPDWKHIPVVVTTGIVGTNVEKSALDMGAWDYLRKPYDSDIVKARIKNAIYRSQLSAFNELKYLAEYDNLTGLYNKKKFFDVTRLMLTCNSDKKFVFVKIEIDRSELMNAYFNSEVCDKLMIYVSKEIQRIYSGMSYCSFGRIESEVFCICHCYDESKILQLITDIRNVFSNFNPEYDVVPYLGLYVIEDNNLPINTIYNRATLAAGYSKGNYVKFYTLNNEKKSNAVLHEQEIINDMKGAIEGNQFDIYFQPKYSLKTNKPYGAEALVRWFHPKKGMITPGEFIPIFEKNGLISKLDFFVWEKACQYLRKWMDNGMNPYPISVNVSRVNMYNPKIVEIIKGITDKYDIPPSLLNLELTESAYVENPVTIKEVITKLQNYGFIILMDDFGSGYSSLNALKDISVDILKVDMKFLSNTDIPGRGDNILASVIRMAKWINLPVVVEGVETLEQTRFLKSIGCDFVQGFYFACPMPEDEYLKLIDVSNEKDDFDEIKLKITEKNTNLNELFDNNPNMEMIFGNVLQPIVIIEYSEEDKNIELLRVNEGYYDLFGTQDEAIKTKNVLSVIHESFRNSILEATDMAVKLCKITETEYIRTKNDGSGIWIRIRLQYIQKVGNKHILFGTLNDITTQKEIDLILNMYKKDISVVSEVKEKMLIVDDHSINRVILSSMFNDKYQIIEAEDGYDALRAMKENPGIDVIILDLIMPNMDGKEFMSIIKKNDKTADIPVIVITSDDSPESQMELITLGASDYIIKPFLKEIVLKRVDNVMVSYSNKQSIKRKTHIAEKLSELFN